MEQSSDKKLKRSPAKENLALARNLINLKELEILIEYYNQKYEERGNIHHVFFNLDGDGSDLKNKLDKISNDSDCNPIKLIITSIKEDKISHSEPFCLSKNKLISLRDSTRFSEFFQKNSSDLKIPFITPKIVKGKSYQGDAESCHFIAIAILKDLTKEDLKRLSSVEDGYIPSAKMFKYSQSISYIEGFNKEMLKSKIKESEPQDLGSYISTYKNGSDDGSIIKDKYENKFEKIIKHVSNFPDEKISMQKRISFLLEEENKKTSDKPKNPIKFPKFSKLTNRVHDNHV